MSSQISARFLLYHKISQYLVVSDVRSLRAMLATDNKLERARLGKAAGAHEIFIKLEEAGEIGRGNLGLLIKLLTTLGHRRLAEEARKVEEEEKKDLQSENKRKKDDVVDSLRRLKVRREADKTSSRVTEQQLYKLAGNLGREWEMLAIYLGMTTADVFKYKADNPRNPRSQIFSMLMDWRARKGSGATVGALVRNLEEAGVDFDTFEFLTQKNDTESDDSDTEKSDVEDLGRPIDPPIRPASEPIEVELGGAEMKALYDQACEQGTHLVFNTLLMLVGKHGNGKSSLHDSLLQLEFNEHKPSTDGIMITPCLMTGKEKWTITKEIGDKNADFLHALRTEMIKKRKEMEEIDQVVPEEETEQPGLGPHPLQTDPSTKGHMEEAASSQRRPVEDSRSFKLATSTGISRDLSHIVGSKERPAISIWDFAGHGIYYSNHHVLYTHYAIYILTLNLKNPLSADLKPQSAEEEDQSGICAEALQLKTEGDLVDYHLESIRVHTRPKKRDLKDGDQAEDDKRDREPTVIVVGTHKDQVMTKTITTFHADIKAHLKGKAINKHVYDRCFAIDNTKRDPEDPELSELRDAILNIAQEQNHVGRRIPISWLELKSELIEMTKQGRSYCSLQDVIDATDHSRVPEGFTPEENAVIILRFFHLCGDILYFDTPELRNFVVLDPQWFVDVQKTIITIPEYRRDGKPTQWERLEDEGVLEGTLVDAVWGNKKKQEDLKCDLIAYKDELLKMMEQFDLVLQCSPESEDGTSTATSADTTYFVPSLLTAATEEAKLFPKGTNRSKPIFVDFNDKFFPIGLYHRLVIACMRRYKRKPPLAYANCARFVTNNRRQTFVITKERHYLKVELSSSVKEESACFSHGPAVRECLDEDLKRIIGDWIPGIGYKWYFGCFCAEHKEMEREENRFIPITTEDVEEWFQEGEAVCDQFEPATTTIKDIGLAHWYQDEYAEQRNIVLPQASSDDAVAQEMAKMQLSNRQHMAVPPEVDSEPVTEKQLNMLAGKLGKDWENLAIHLDLTTADVDRYKADNPYNTRSQIFSMLMGWRARKGSGATVGALVRNLEEFGVALDTFEFLTQKS
ncbi:PREDICTED: uncharacterized protein LOC109476875 [Branchiostoma belcheri]|uniref:Uncharacterized protein LOC109476875 n=1 Tax=Branchiostoma belcheri TaxID=7741 RepID=A0A6P4ZHE9_BRABE|nr:PREDICTED: uncharacterized protein LOC109476875 [Branchiostoma belcheri]